MPDKPPMETFCRDDEWELVEGISPAFGLSVATDVKAVDAHRLTVTASFTHAFETDTRTFSYTSFALGVGYRFWAP